MWEEMEQLLYFQGIETMRNFAKRKTSAQNESTVELDSILHQTNRLEVYGSPEAGGTMLSSVVDIGNVSGAPTAAPTAIRAA